MIQSILRHSAKGVENITSAQVKENEKSFLWVDVEEPDEEDFEFLRKKFGIHPLACDPVFDPHIRPKIMEFDSHLFIVFHEPIQEDHGFLFSRLDLLLGRNFLVTIHKKTLPSIDTLKEMLDKNPGLLKKGPSFFTYMVLDHVTDNYFPILDEIDDITDEIENAVFLNSSKSSLRSVFSLKRKLLELRKRISPEREILAALSRHDSGFISQNSIIYFRDIYDHMIRVSDMVDIYRDLLTSILDVYVSVQSNKLNEIMKVLTVISTVMLPLTLITGFYGMNIAFPEVTLLGQNAYYFVWALMLAVAVVMLLYFIRKKWV